ncbi:MAG: hypothetical protein BGO07_01205 [Alphaproteobacteria bacterium 40-19]|nr:MAG: hypothetical protein BGO07_01205 [Alphaproteobacteria bacterium 40-19]
MNIHFEKVTQQHLDTIFSWMSEGFSRVYKDDIVHFVVGRKADEHRVYWLAFDLFMTARITHKTPVNREK